MKTHALLRNKMYGREMQLISRERERERERERGGGERKAV